MISSDSNDTAFQTTGFVLVSFIMIFSYILDKGDMRGIIGVLFDQSGGPQEFIIKLQLNLSLGGESMLLVPWTRQLVQAIDQGGP